MHVSVSQRVRHLAAAAPGQSHHGHFTLVRSLNGRQHVSGVSAGRDGQQHIARLAQGTHLARENRGEIVVVGNRCDDGGVRRQRNRTQLGALTLVAAHKLGREMLRVCRRAAIAARQHLAATGHTGQHGLYRLSDRLAKRLGRLVLQVGTVNKVLLNALFEHGVDDNAAIAGSALGADFDANGSV